MNRKIAAIMAADIAGYSKLVAEDEEETVRRLSSYRAVFDDFVARASGRVFNTAGDAILAEFPSAVEAVRCAIDVQESLRTRNLAYPSSRQMHFRIGITIGDVVERGEDLLGDGVNIAARLEGLAAPGGICISRSIYEQVASKLSVAFVDIGEQQVKNIPSPIHAYTLALGSTDAGAEKTRAKKQPARRGWGLMITAAAVITFAVAGGYTLYFLKSQPLVRTLTGHGAEADSVAFSPDGRLIAACGYDGAIIVWFTANGQPQPPAISSFCGHAASFSPDGKRIAAASASSVKLWDAATKRPLMTFSGHSAQVLTVAFSRDGKSLVSGGRDHMVFIWDLVSNQPGRQFAGHSDQVYSVTFSSDGKRVASASFDQTVIVWNVASGQRVKTHEGPNKMMAAIFSSDDAWLAIAGGDGNVTVLDTSSWQVTQILRGNGQSVNAIAFSPGDKLIASAGDDSMVKVWDTATGALVRTYAGHTGTIWGVEFSPDGKWVASASSDKTVKIWKAPRFD